MNDREMENLFHFKIYDVPGESGKYKVMVFPAQPQGVRADGEAGDVVPKGAEVGVLFADKFDIRDIWFKPPGREVNGVTEDDYRRFAVRQVSKKKFRESQTVRRSPEEFEAAFNGHEADRFAREKAYREHPEARRDM
jgi:hypothetical protein